MAWVLAPRRACRGKTGRVSVPWTCYNPAKKGGVMKITGETLIAAPQEAVWRALNDPAILRQAIPGCESLEQTADNAFKATVSSRIGPISARFAGNVRLSDLDPPNSYTLTGEGTGGAAGAAKGVAKVRLEPAAGGTRLV